MKKIFYGLFLLCSLALPRETFAQTKVTFYTDMGNFVMDLYDTLQPITTDNFKTLVNNQFYDSLIIHRVVANFVIQAGDPWGPATGPGWTIPDEFDANTSNVQKAVSMANAGPNTGGSQFFINLVNNLSLNANYPVFGMVSSGFPVVQNIGAVAVDANDKPLTDIFIDSARITAFPTYLNEWYKKNRILCEIYPNPAGSYAYLSLKSDRAEIVEIMVNDLLGKVMTKQTFHLNAGLNNIPFSALNWSKGKSGMYVFSIKSSDGLYTRKVIFNAEQ